MQKITLEQLIEQELNERNAQKEKIKSLIEEQCIINSTLRMSREEWQKFCFKNLYKKETFNSSFMTYMNKLMPELGFPLGHKHNNIAVYKGLNWKIKQ